MICAHAHIASSFCPVYFCFTKAILLLCYLHLLTYVWFLTFGFLGLTPGDFLGGTCQKLPILCWDGHKTLTQYFAFYNVIAKTDCCCCYCSYWCCVVLFCQATEYAYVSHAVVCVIVSHPFAPSMWGCLVSLNDLGGMPSEISLSVGVGIGQIKQIIQYCSVATEKSPLFGCGHIWVL